MKNVTPTSKTLILVSTLLAFVFSFSACSDEKARKVKKEETDWVVFGNYSKVQIIEIDSCQYIFGDWGNATVLTHKGNCKFCRSLSK